MKASDLIRTLAEGISRHGDKEVMIKSAYDDFYSHIHGVISDRHLNVHTSEGTDLHNQTLTIIYVK